MKSRRRQSPLKRFFSRIFAWIIALSIVAILGTLIGFISLRASKGVRQVTIHAPEEALVPPVQAPNILRIATYNIAHGRGPEMGAENDTGETREERLARLQRIGEFLRDQRLDLVVLNELDFNAKWSLGIDQAEYIADIASFPYVVKQRNYDTGIPYVARWEFGNAILSRFPIEEAEFIDMPALKQMENVFVGNHDAVLAKVRLSQDKTIGLLGVHLEYRSEETRVQCATKIVATQRDLDIPLIVAGDFNSTFSRMPGNQTAPSSQNAMEILANFGKFTYRPRKGKATPMHFTFPTQGPRTIIDWIVPDSGWAFVDHTVVRGMQESDHLPVISTIRRR